MVTRCWKISIWSAITNGLLVTMVTTFTVGRQFGLGEFDVIMEVLNLYSIWVVFFYKEELMRGADFMGPNSERIP